jgi:hypothetical protein
METGFDYAEWQDRLAATWHSDGPERVHAMLRTASLDDLLTLAMLNVGERATDM